MSMDRIVPVYRAMKLEDVPLVVEIELEAFTSPWTKGAFVNELTSNMFARYLVAEYEGELIGYGGMWIIMDEAHVTNIALRKEYRSKGYGKMLLMELQRTAMLQGAERMTLEVRASNEQAQRLYRKLGFKPSGIRPNYYSDNGEDAIIMWAELDADALQRGFNKSGEVRM
jgi:[ribosomal protein S18]-alanine N-acetyltransferase